MQMRDKAMQVFLCDNKKKLKVRDNRICRNLRDKIDDKKHFVSVCLGTIYFVETKFFFAENTVVKTKRQLK